MKMINLELPEAVLSFAEERAAADSAQSAAAYLGALLCRAAASQAREEDDENALMLGIAALNYGEIDEEEEAVREWMDRQARRTLH